MRKLVFPFWTLLSVIFSCLSIGSISTASAQATRTWVSGVGDDANPCSRTAPCKTFAGAISKTAAGGEINVIDAGGFGALTITKSLSIIAQGSTAGVLVSGTNGIIVNAGVNDVVVLRGLDINGTFTGLNGVRFLGGAALHIQNCNIRNFQGAPPNGFGVQFAPSNGIAELYVTDTSLSFNGNSATNGGIGVKPTGSAGANVVLTRSSVENNGTGIIADGSSTSGKLTIMMRDSQTVGNTHAGFLSTKSGTTVAIRVLIDRSLAGNNGTGIVSDGEGSVVTITGSTVSGNNVGLSATNNGNILSYLNNYVNSNLTNDGATTGTLAPK
ncbi:hypothetical protein [Bradyrhizobium centrosematis]|uniref:hypothetical protein n=1 Tax=Bradyrhizobium centrosematis TaxID=1300039 RepID=UPI002167A3C1|nr:hypothetical protein [Bradyrhizobium centrosematis]MCS3765345.1 hypothetical protein [Bradyrhizobium centrosematis]MCS3773955.1 hypothetical protein [Bradyrhizobium centrosematis]